MSDLNQDCKVNSFDLSIFGEEWRINSDNYKIGDIHHDGCVDEFDLLIFADEWLEAGIAIE